MSKKPTLYDLFNDESLWGNQTAGDLTHEEIMDDGWNRKFSQSQKDLLSRKANERYADESYRQKHKQSLEKIYSNPAWQEKMKKLGQDPEINSIRSAASKKMWDDPIKSKQLLKKFAKVKKTKAYKEKMKKVYQDPDRLKKVIEGGRTQSKAVITPDGEFAALNDAAIFYNIAPNSMRGRIKSNPHIYYYKAIGPKDPIVKIKKEQPKYIRKVYTPDGIFDNLKDAAAFYNVHTDTIKYRCRTYSDWNLDDKK